MNLFSINSLFNNKFVNTEHVNANKGDKVSVLPEAVEANSEKEEKLNVSASPLNIFTSLLENKKVPEFYHNFNSGIYEAYHAQLKDFIREKLDLNPTFLERLHQASREKNGFFQDALSLVQLIQLDLPKDESLRRDFHEKVTSLLRALIRQKEVEKDNSPLAQEVADLVDAICLWRYTSPDLLNAMQCFLEEITNISFSAMNEQDYASFLEKFFNSLKANEKLTSSYSPLEEFFKDDYYAGSLPFLLYKIDSTQLVYTTRITSESFKDQKLIVVTDEFKNYLSALKKEGKTHLYINLMKRLDFEGDKAKVNKATDRMISEVIEELENNPDFEGTIMVATIDKNSDFYTQKNEFENKYGKEKNIKTFKSDFMNQLFQSSEKSFFKWPKKFDLDQWKEKTNAILEAIHQTYFQNKEHLSTEERKIFIELSLTKMIKSLHEELQPNTSNITCKHSMDRAPSTFGLLYALEKYESQGSLSQKDMEALLTMVFTPAVFSQNKGIAASRFETFLLAFRYLMKHYT